ncbi:MAG: hypothetical protein AB1635_16325, partial [Acidobacteriota bacterium]
GGGGRRGGSNDTPVLFYSRRIGLESGRVVPILGGARMLGRVGAWQVGALSMQTDDVPAAGIRSTNFSVLRVNRDLLRRSRIGFLTTRRDAGAVSGDTVGADAQFGLTNDLTVLGYVAATRSSARPDADDELSYRARMDWNADRYGFQAEHLYVGEDFNPEMGFLRRSAFRRSMAEGRFSPRPAGSSVIRKWDFEGSYDRFTSVSGRLESEETQGTVRMELQNGDMWNVEVTRAFEAIDARFEVARAVFVPVGEYAFSTVKGTYILGPQRRVNGSITAGRGGFYDGTLTELTWRGRVDVTSQFYVEPQLSWNKVEVPWGAADTNLVSTRWTYTISPRMFASALIQYQSRTASVSTNARLRWEYQPGSELFIVYSDGRTTLSRGIPDVENRSFVVKITKLFRW